MPLENLKMIGGAGAGASVILLLICLLVDPTRADQVRLSGAAHVLGESALIGTPARRAGLSMDILPLVDKPIFIMSTGNNAYAEKTLQLFGVSISSDRRAALVSIDGAPASWIRVGQLEGDVQLVDVSASSARFDTPIGQRSITINDPAPVTPAAASPAG